MGTRDHPPRRTFRRPAGRRPRAVHLAAPARRRPQARFPVTFGAGLSTFRTPAPGLGEHTEEVLGELDANEAAIEATH
ncbi:hypothetical protein ACTU45_16720 [Streptomyces sp. 24-1644]|uniref:hypothetical protein n=1 Tax=Streptomyces sp. 24-1644 TaxID=3457315 RepID=UPI003FA7AEF7